MTSTITTRSGTVATLPTVGDPPPPDVWCGKCDSPTYAYVDGTPMCRDHTSDALWKANSPQWAGSPERRGR